MRVGKILRIRSNRGVTRHAYAHGYEKLITAGTERERSVNEKLIGTTLCSARVLCTHTVAWGRLNGEKLTIDDVAASQRLVGNNKMSERRVIRTSGEGGGVNTI